MINESEDYVAHFQCGCRVVFTGESLHNTSRMIACSQHDHKDDLDIRTRIVFAAKNKLRLAKIGQPPR